MPNLDYTHPVAYWNERAKKCGVSAPGLAGTTANDKALFKTIDQIGHFHNLLDFGCGTGRLYSTLYKHCEIYTGIDFSKEMLDLFRSQNFKAIHQFDSLHLQDLSGEITFKDGTFDGAIVNMVLQHIVELNQFHHAVANIKRLVKKEGSLYIHEAMLDPAKYPKYPHITLRPMHIYQGVFYPEFDLKPMPSYVKDHTLLCGKKLC
jgi:ubiquinone/menaquinone biosynthesis C-methylase UbiE